MRQRWALSSWETPAAEAATLATGPTTHLNEHVLQPGRREIAFEPIVAIELAASEPVYDIEVEGTHNFVANGIFAHNTSLEEPAMAQQRIASWQPSWRGNLTSQLLFAVAVSAALLAAGVDVSHAADIVSNATQGAVSLIGSASELAVSGFDASLPASFSTPDDSVRATGFPGFSVMGAWVGGMLWWVGQAMVRLIRPPLPEIPLRYSPEEAGEFQKWVEGRIAPENSIVSVRGGGAFILAEDEEYSYALSNGHVVHGAIDVFIRTAHGSILRGQVIGSPGRSGMLLGADDVALIAIAKSEQNGRGVTFVPLTLIADGFPLEQTVGRYVTTVSGFWRIVRQPALVLSHNLSRLELLPAIGSGGPGDSGSPGVMRQGDQLVVVGMQGGAFHGRAILSLATPKRNRILEAIRGAVPIQAGQREMPLAQYVSADVLLLRRAVQALERAAGVSSQGEIPGTAGTRTQQSQGLYEGSGEPGATHGDQDHERSTVRGWMMRLLSHVRQWLPLLFILSGSVLAHLAAPGLGVTPADTTVQVMGLDWSLILGGWMGHSVWHGIRWLSQWPVISGRWSVKHSTTSALKSITELLSTYLQPIPKIGAGRPSGHTRNGSSPCS